MPSRNELIGKLKYRRLTQLILVFYKILRVYGELFLVLKLKFLGNILLRVYVIILIVGVHPL